MYNHETTLFRSLASARNGKEAASVRQVNRTGNGITLPTYRHDLYVGSHLSFTCGFHLSGRVGGREGELDSSLVLIG